MSQDENQTKVLSEKRKTYLANVSNILTNERKEYLNDLYYKRGYVLGRDALFEITKKERDIFAERYRITEPTDKRLNKFPTKRAIGQFLANQELQQLYRGPVLCRWRRTLVLGVLPALSVKGGLTMSRL